MLALLPAAFRRRLARERKPRAGGAFVIPTSPVSDSERLLTQLQCGDLVRGHHRVRGVAANSPTYRSSEVRAIRG
jgi:hypothetical protein